MAKSFYTAQEAADRLGKTEDELKALVRDGELREFRDAGKFTYRVDDVDKLAPTLDDLPAGLTAAGASASGEIVLEPVEDSSIELAPAGSDVLSLEEVDAAEETSGGTTGVAKSKEDSVVASVGINVFDDDELDEEVDPLAQTAVTDVGGLGIDGPGSGSGIMNLSRESDDTSLGAELLDEIYGGDEEGAAVEMGEATRAGLEEAITDEPAPAPAEEEVFSVDTGTTEAAPRISTTQVVEYGPDAVSTSLTALMVVAVVVMWVAGLGAAAMVRGVSPRIITAIYENLPLYAGGTAGVAALTAGVSYFLAKRSK